jgi:uncharacterized integral membrane protein
MNSEKNSRIRALRLNIDACNYHLAYLEKTSKVKLSVVLLIITMLCFIPIDIRTMAKPQFFWWALFALGLKIIGGIMMGVNEYYRVKIIRSGIASTLKTREESYDILKVVEKQ